MKTFDVEVFAVNDDGETALGKVRILDVDEDTARCRAMDDLWDPRLDAASCRARFVTTEVTEEVTERYTLCHWNDQGHGVYVGFWQGKPNESGSELIQGKLYMDQDIAAWRDLGLDISNWTANGCFPMDGDVKL